VLPDPARKRVLETFLDPKTIAALLALGVAAIISVFKLTEILPDSIKRRATPGELTAIVTLLVWLAIALVLVVWYQWRERQRHPDGKPKPGKVAIYVAELKGDDKQGSHRNHILLTLRQHLGISVQVLRAGIELRAEEKGNPEDDSSAANMKGQRYLNLSKHRGDLLIWGQILQESKLVELRFTSAAHDGAEQMRFTFAEKMLLAPDFGPELATALAAIAAQLVLSGKNPVKYVADVLIPVAEKLSRIVANLPVLMGPDQRGLLQLSYATAELAIGEQRGDSGALNRAIAAYREALNEYMQERVPLDWARTQNNLGVALFIIGERESGTERLEAAVVAYREALKEWKRDKVPLLWATAQNNLGTALLRLGEHEGGTERLEASVAAHREALKERPREKVPLDWATTQVNLGLALLALGKRESGTERLKAAVAANHEALKELTQEESPLKWAQTQINLGVALHELGKREGGTESFQAAAVAYRNALKECTRERVPLQWAQTQNNLGAAVEMMGKLDEAGECYQLSLEVLTPANHARMFASATSNLARVLEKRLSPK
jgi:tetratricopeptide (TPR) repeat protein